VRDLRTLGKHWNDAALERIAAGLPRRAQSRPWPMLGMLALGLVAGAALGGYAVTQRARMKRLATYAHSMRDELVGEPEDKPAAVVTSTPSNHRRKATSEV
jgi:hypothetical protein